MSALLSYSAGSTPERENFFHLSDDEGDARDTINLDSDKEEELDDEEDDNDTASARSIPLSSPERAQSPTRESEQVRSRAGFGDGNYLEDDEYGHAADNLEEESATSKLKDLALDPPALPSLTSSLGSPSFMSYFSKSSTGDLAGSTSVSQSMMDSVSNLRDLHSDGGPASSVSALNRPLMQSPTSFHEPAPAGPSTSFEPLSMPMPSVPSGSTINPTRSVPGQSFTTPSYPSSSSDLQTQMSLKYSMKYPPPPLRLDSDSVSMASVSSSASRKARPESMLLDPPKGAVVLGIALVEFNHLVGPKLEFSEGEIFDDPQIIEHLPFLALPDGAHISSEDYSYFHLVPSSPNPATIFAISCNRQIKTSDLLFKPADVTRSMVQKAVVVLASVPVFGPIRDKLGVVTRALFDQRDFSDTSILTDFYSSLELSLRSQLTHSGLYMGTSLRELVHVFRSRTLLLLKALMLQKRIMFYGHPVERLCTYQYSLISLIPGLLQTLQDCGSPPLASRAPTLQRPSSLRTSDRKSLLAYLGLPLDIFGKDAFFQPYLPLQQMDMIQDTGSWLCGTTNSIVTQRKEIDLLINIETNTFEFRNPQLERLIALTPADRKWMDEIVKDVNDSWHQDQSRPFGLAFKGSDDYLRSKFEEYVSFALASVKYADFLAKGDKQDVIITGGYEGGSDPRAVEDFNPIWIAEFRQTNAFEVWNRVTDPLLFDICEARHPCAEKPNVVSDIGLRLQEGLQDLKLDQQLAPTREAISRTIQTGSTSFFKAVEGVRERWMIQRTASESSGADEVRSSSTSSSPPVEITASDVASSKESIPTTPNGNTTAKQSGWPGTPISSRSLLETGSATLQSASASLRPLSLVAAQAATDTKSTLGSWRLGVGSFFARRTSTPSTGMPSSTSPPPGTPASNSRSPSGSQSITVSQEEGYDEFEFKPKDLGEGHGPNGNRSPSRENEGAKEDSHNTGSIPMAL